MKLIIDVLVKLIRLYQALGLKFSLVLKLHPSDNDTWIKKYLEDSVVDFNFIIL